MTYAIGLDYGTNSVRCLIVDVADGKELGTAVYEYETGEAGIILDSSDHNLARQNPADYLKGAEITIKEALAAAKQAGAKWRADPRVLSTACPVSNCSGRTFCTGRGRFR